MSLEKQPKEEVRVMFPEETKLFNIYKKIRESIKRIKSEFEDEYEVSNITTGVTITASITPSLTKKKA